MGEFVSFDLEQLQFMSDLFDKYEDSIEEGIYRLEIVRKDMECDNIIALEPYITELLSLKNNYVICIEEVARVNQIIKGILHTI